MDQRQLIQPDVYFQHTLRDAMTFAGHGLHSGRQIVMRVIPSEPDSGIIFSRKDAGDAEVPALWHMVSDTHQSITLGNAHGVQVAMVEYLLAALYACGIDNARITLDGPEVPIMDGSALPYVSRIDKIGSIKQTEPRRAILIRKSVSIFDKDRYAGFTPFPFPWINLEYDFEPESVGWQRLSLPIDQRTFMDELAPSRTTSHEERASTFGLPRHSWVASQRQPVLVNDDRVMNEDGQRYPDEYVRHAAVCCIGVMALAGARIVGRFNGRRTNRQINATLVRELMTRDDSRQHTTLAEATGYWKRLAE